MIFMSLFAYMIRFSVIVRTIKLIFVLASALVTVALPAQAQTLYEAMARAYAEHPALGAQRANLSALDADVDSARGGWRPTLSATTSAGRNTTKSSLAVNAQMIRDHRNASDMRISVSQPLLNWSAGPAIEASQERLWQGGADLLHTEQTVLLDVATAYLNVLQARRLLVLNQTNERSLARQVEYRHAHLERQLGTRTELAQAQARHAGARAQLDRVRAELQIASSAFFRHVGKPPGQLTFPENLTPLPDSLELVLEQAIINMPSVRSAYHGTQAARADLKSARGKLMPSLNLEAAGAWTREPTQAIRTQRDASILLNLRIPIYQAGVQRAQVQGTTQRVMQRQSEWRNSRLEASYEASDAWSRLQAAHAEIEAFDAAITANKVAYEGVSAERAALGELTLIEVLNAQQELFLSETALVQARTQAAVAHLRLLAVQGRLTAAALGLAVSADIR